MAYQIFFSDVVYPKDFGSFLQFDYFVFGQTNPRGKLSKGFVSSENSKVGHFISTKYQICKNLKSFSVHVLYSFHTVKHNLRLMKQTIFFP